MLITNEVVKNILDEQELNPSKNKGQNYLIDPNISKKIVEVLDIKDKESVLEIGPGLGSLSHFILVKTKMATFIDIDKKTINFLQRTYEDGKFVNLDALKIRSFDENKIISNLPYNITTPLIVHVLLNAHNCTKFVFMCQAEVLDKFLAKSGTNYGPLSILIRLIGKIKKEFDVSKNAFYPRPKCTSSVFSITKEDTYTNEEIYGTYKIAKAMFNNRRKTIFNNLSSYLNDKEKAEKILSEININLKARPEDITEVGFLNILRRL